MKIEQPSIKAFVSERRALFKIPEFQRPYSWGPDNAREMLDDLETCIHQADKNHYFGTVFYTNENGSTASTIIDGQQRITTTLLMIMSIYHLVSQDPSRGLGGSDPHTHYTEKQISDEFLYDSEFAKVKLRTVAYDNQIFQDIYDTGGSHLGKSEKRSNLWRVYKTFYDYFEAKPTLNQYINALDSFHIIKIGLEGGDDKPQRIFESINSTGRPLTDGDKIRNFALMLDNAGMRTHVYQNYWRKIEHALTNPDRDEITDFFRDYLIAKQQSVIQTTEVYTKFKQFFRTQITDQSDQSQLDAFYEDILQHLGYYLLLVLGDEDQSSHYRKTIIPQTALHLRYIRSGLYIPFGMSVLAEHSAGRLSAAELDQIFALIETYFSRRLICNISASSLDKVFADLHRNVTSILDSEPKASYVEVLKFVLLRRTGQTRLPNDTELMAAITGNDFYHQRHSNVMYILCAANDIHRPKSSSVLSQIINGSLKLTVEHIMPQTIDKKTKNGAKWIAMLGPDWQEIHKQYLHTLGNLTITGYNTEYSNLPYVDPQHPERSKMHLVDRKGNHVGLADGDFIVNQYIAKHFSTWDAAAIRKRQKWWLKSFQKLWPYPTTDFSPTISDTSMPLDPAKDYTNCRISSINVLDSHYLVSQWTDALDYIAEALYEQDPRLFAEALDDDFLATYVSRSKTPPRSATQVLDTDFYVSVNNNTNTKIKIILAFMQLYHLDRNDIKIGLV